MNKLITDKDFEQSLPLRLESTKDVFLFGCTTTFSYSDPHRLPAKMQNGILTNGT